MTDHKGAVTMTDRWVQAVTVPDGGRREFFDKLAPGLFLRVSGESKVWGFRYRSPTGGQPRMRLGHYVTAADAREMEKAAALAGEEAPSPLTVAGARVKARRLRGLVDEGRDPAAEEKASKDAVKAQPLQTIEDLADTYFTACEKGRYRPRKKVKRASTIAGERWLYAKHLKPHFGAVRIEALTRAAIVKPLDALADEGKGVTANRARALLRQLYAYATSLERVAANPVAGIDAPVEEKSRERILSDDETRALWKALKDTTGIRRPLPGGGDVALTVGRPIRIALQLALLTLQRRGEIASMHEDDLDLDAGVWTVPAERAKNGRANLVPLAPTSVALIREAMALRPADAQGRVSRWVFPRRGVMNESPISAAAISHAMRDLRAAIGVSDITTHDLRRSSASRLGDAGVSGWEVGLLLNHAGQRDGAAAVTSVYVRSRHLEQRRRVLATLEQLVLEAVGEREASADVVTLKTGMSR